MKQLLCPQCRKMKADRAFRNREGRREKICNLCRAKHKETLTVNRAIESQVDKELNRILDKQKARFINDQSILNIRALERKIYAERRALKVLLGRIEKTKRPERTESAIGEHRKRLSYFEDIRVQIANDAKWGRPRPLAAYLEDDATLHKHGFLVTYRRTT